MSYYIHDIEGRLRIKSPKIKKNPTNINELKKILSCVNGIATLDINPTTGSLLINYNPKLLKSKDITSLLQNKGYFDASKAITNDEYIKNNVSKAGNFLTKTVIGASVETALAGTPFSFLAVLI
ncbi:MAG: hypothetical protein N2738_02360 [Thermodesulfovibrionales bacterium]|nr:hypothetical protein [Thermodesulfovibrionales bacterium]